MGREERQALPRFMLQETRTEVEWDGEERVDNYWHPFAEYHQVETHVAASDRPGYGTDLRRISFQVYDLTLTFRLAHEVEPQTMLDLALALTGYPHTGCTRLGAGVKVDVELHSVRNTPTVFWNSRTNSYAIVRPAGDPVTADAEARLTWDQGVLLLCVNGIGEIRWDVDPASKYPEEGDREAIAHFGLTRTGTKTAAIGGAA